MADQWYTQAKTHFANGEIDWVADNIKAVAVDAADYILAITTHDALDDIPAVARVATSANLTSASVVDGVLDAADTVFTAATGDQFEYVIVYKDSGIEATSYLIMCYDQDGGGAMSVTPNGTNIDVTWSSGANKMGAL